MVLHLEWLAHAALHGNPGLVFHGFDDLRIFQGVPRRGGDAGPGPRPVRARRPGGTGCSSSRSRSAGPEERPRGDALAGRDRPGRPAAGRPARPANRHPSARPCSRWTRCTTTSCSTARTCGRSSGSTGCGPAGAVAFARTAPPPAEWMQTAGPRGVAGRPARPRRRLPAPERSGATRPTGRCRCRASPAATASTAGRSRPRAYWWRPGRPRQRGYGPGRRRVRRCRRPAGGGDDGRRARDRRVAERRLPPRPAGRRPPRPGSGARAAYETVR